MESKSVFMNRLSRIRSLMSSYRLVLPGNGKIICVCACVHACVCVVSQEYIHCDYMSWHCQFVYICSDKATSTKVFISLAKLSIQLNNKIYRIVIQE